ncbi:DUF58 domain-containing protein [Humidisolicoccus flavus]|uniref:DUF58 domain-containing protein n=1 Tax=Humidisolicoccus flavus TaxID=3111414 RepID=UPI0032439A1C
MRAAQARRLLTPWGWAMLVLALVCIVLALLFGWRELVVISAGSMTLILLAMPWIAGTRSVGAHITLEAERVAVGAAASATVTVTRATRRLSPSSINLAVDDDSLRIDLEPLPVGGSSDHVIDLDTRLRGRVRIGPMSLVRTDPYGLMRRTHNLTGVAELVVHPRTVRIPGIATGHVRDLEGIAAAEFAADDISFHSLREYTPGDHPRIVHWRSSAKSGSLLVRQFEPSKRSDVLVALSTNGTEHTAADFELAVGVAATLCQDALLDSRGLRLVTSPTPKGDVPELDVRTRARMLDGLADVAAESEATITELARRISLSSSASIAWLLVGSGVGARELRLALQQLPHSMHAVVVRCDADAVPAVVQLGSSTVVTLGVLDDLARVLEQGSLS